MAKQDVKQATVAEALDACAAAIRQTWPTELQAQAEIVLQLENGSHRADRRGYNTDGSTDNGCLQVNDRAHFGTKGWTVFDQIFDADFNTAYAYKIYQGRGNFSAWYSVCTPQRVSKIKGIQC